MADSSRDSKNMTKKHNAENSHTQRRAVRNRTCGGHSSFIHFTTKLRDTPENKDLSNYMKKTEKPFCTKQMNKTFHPTRTRQAGDVSLFALEGRILGSCWNPSIFQIGISQNRTVYDSLGGFHRWLLLFSVQKFYPYSLRTKDRLGPLGYFKACASWRGSSAWSSGVKVWL